MPELRNPGTGGRSGGKAPGRHLLPDQPAKGVETMRILVWHVHGGWMEAFVRGRHEYLLPKTSDGGAWGLGRGGRDWPAAAQEVDLAGLDPDSLDAVVL